MSDENQLGKLETAIQGLDDKLSEHLNSVGVLQGAFAEFKTSTFPEFKAAIADNFKSMAANISDLKKVMSMFVRYGLAAIVSIWLGIAVLWGQIHTLDTKVSPIGTTLTKISDSVSALKPPPGAGGLSPTPTITVPVLDEAQRDLVQKQLPPPGLKLWPAADKLAVGEVVNDPNVLSSVPDGVTKAVPALVGAFYAAGRTSIVFVSPPSNRIVAIVQRRG